MNMKKLCLAVSLLVLAPLSFGESYQFEVGGTYSQAEIDYGYGFGSADLDTISLRGKVHFSKLVTSGQPKAEESFLAQSNNFSLVHSMTDGDGWDTTVDLARLEFYVPSAMLYIAPFYVYSAIDDDVEDESDNTYGLSLGLTPIEGLRVFTTWVDEVDYEINLQTKYVKELGNGTAMNIELGYEKSGDSDFDDYIGAAFDFYFDPSLSIGAFYDSSAGINKVIIDTNFYVGEDSYGVRASKYVNDSIGLYGSYATSDDIDSLNIGLNCRF